ncbi:MAG: hypothetical protein ABIC82_04115 [bacterium]
MSKLIKRGKIALVVSLTISTVVWSIGLAAFTPTVFAASAGDLIKQEGSASVYYLGTDSKRYLFPNNSTFQAWYGSGATVTTVSSEVLLGYELGGNAVARAGRLVQVVTNDSPWMVADAKVYALSNSGTIQHIDSAETAVALFGANWESKIIPVPEQLFSNYTEGDALTSSSMIPDGFLVSDGTDTYLIDGGSKRAVSAEGFTANMYKESDKITKTDLSAYEDGSAVSGSESGLFNIAGGATVATPVVVKGGLTVGLASDAAPSSTVIQGQAVANLASFNLTASTEGAVKVTTLKVKRTGVSADATLSNVYLFEGTTRLTDNASVSSGYVTWNNSAGIISIPAGTTKTVTVKSDIAGSTSGQIVGVSINAASDITTDGGSVSGTFPVSGNLMSVASATLAGVTLNATTTPSTDGTPSAGETQFSLWNNSIAIATRDVDLEFIRFRQIGSVRTTDIQNFTFYIDGVKQGTAQQLGSDGYVAFDFSASPIRVKTGNKIFEVRADLIGGSSYTTSLSLRQAADLIIVDSEYGANITATAIPASSVAQTIASGTLSINKMTDSPSGNVLMDSAGATLAKYEIKAYGEDIKIEYLRVAVVESDGDTAFTLRNGALYANGTQIGSTTAIAATTDATQAYTDFTLGSSLIVKPGTPVTLEVKADIYDSDGTNDVAVNDTLQVRLVVYSSGAQKLTSLGFINVPSNNTDANAVTVATGSLSGVKNTSYANQDTVDNLSNYKLGSFTISASEGEDINISNFTVAVTYTDTVADGDTAATTLTDLYVKYGDVATTPKATVSATSNSFSVSKKIANNSQMNVDVYANMNSTPDATDTIAVSLAVTGTTASSGTSANVAAVPGQTITIQSGAITAAVDGGTPVTGIVVAGNDDVTVAKYKFTTQYTPVTLKDVTVQLITVANANSVISAKLDLDNDGTADTPAVVPVSGIFSFTGLAKELIANSNTTIGVMLKLNDVTTNGTSGANLAMRMTGYKYSIAGSDTTVASQTYDGNAQYIRNTIPIVAKNSSSTSLVNAEMEIYKFTVSANSNANVALKQMKFAVAITDNTTDQTLLLQTFKFFRGSDDISDNVSITDNSASPVNLKTSNFTESLSQVIVRFTSEEVITKGISQTYTLKATPSGFSVGAEDDYFTVQMSGDTAAATAGYTYLVDTDATASESIAGLGVIANTSNANYNFIWSDNSKTVHTSTLTDDDGSPIASTSSADWMNGYLIKSDLPGSTVQYTY